MKQCSESRLETFQWSLGGRSEGGFLPVLLQMVMFCHLVAHAEILQRLQFEPGTTVT